MFHTCLVGNVLVAGRFTIRSCKNAIAHLHTKSGIQLEHHRMNDSMSKKVINPEWISLEARNHLRMIGDNPDPDREYLCVDCGKAVSVFESAHRKFNTGKCACGGFLFEPTTHGCLTHHATHCKPEWLAIHRDSAINLLEGYDLTDEQKNDAGALMAGYCRLLEEAGLVHYGGTEQEAIESALR